MDPKNTKRVYSTMVVKAVDEEKREITGIASTPGTDRMGDIVVPAGAKFNLPVPLLWQHEHDQPIGQVIAAKVTDAGIEIVARLAKIDAPSQLAARLEEAWQSIKHGLVRGLSIGFRPLKYAFLDDGGIEFSEWDWYELSAVTIPANAEASITSVKSFDTALRASSGTKRDGVVRLDKSPAGVSAPKQRKSINPTPKEGNDMNIAEQRKAFQEKRKATQEALTALMVKAAEEGRTLDAEEQEEFDGHEAEIKSIDDHLKRLDTFEKAQIATATPVDGSNEKAGMESRAGKIIEVKSNLPKGTRFARYAMALAAGRGSISDALKYAERWQRDTPEVANYIKAVAGTTTAPGWAAELVDQSNLVGEFLELLRPETLLGKLQGFRTVPFNVKIPVQTGGSTIGWVGEGAPKPVGELAFDTLTLGWNKVAGIVVLTEELVRFSTPSAEATVRTDMVAQTAQFLDDAFINPAHAAVAGVSPASVTNGATPVPASGTDVEALIADVQALVEQFLSNNLSPSGAYLVMSSIQAARIALFRNALGQYEFPQMGANGGTMLGFPVVTSENVPTDSSGSIIALIKPSEILLADDGSVALDASREATLDMNGGNAPTFSLWQRNCVGIRAERYITWAPRRAASVAYISGANYSPASGS